MTEYVPFSKLCPVVLGFSYFLFLSKSCFFLYHFINIIFHLLIFFWVLLLLKSILFHFKSWTFFYYSVPKCLVTSFGRLLILNLRVLLFIFLLRILKSFLFFKFELGFTRIYIGENIWQWLSHPFLCLIFLSGVFSSFLSLKLGPLSL